VNTGGGGCIFADGFRHKGMPVQELASSSQLVNLEARPEIPLISIVKTNPNDIPLRIVTGIELNR
jgi:hypothetical protein